MVAELEAEVTEEPVEEVVEEEAPSEPSIDDILSKPEVAERIKEQVAQAARVAEDRVRTKTLVEERKRFANTELVANTLAETSRAILEAGEVTDSVRDRFKNLVATNGQAVLDDLASKVTQAFFTGPYQLSADVQLEAERLIRDGDTDSAIKTLIEAAVAKQKSEADSEFEKRVESEVEKRVKAELKAREEGGSAPPPTPRGGGARLGASLTSAELSMGDRRVQEAIRALPKAQREKLYERVPAADQRRGADTTRDVGTILADLESLS